MRTRWQSTKGLRRGRRACCVAFLFTGWPRDVVALAGAGRAAHAAARCTRARCSAWSTGSCSCSSPGCSSSTTRSQRTGLPRAARSRRSAPHGVDLRASRVRCSRLRSCSRNVVSNVPGGDAAAARSPTHALGRARCWRWRQHARRQPVRSSAASPTSSWSTRRRGTGVVIGWREHARVGVPVTLATLAIAAGWLTLLHA